MVLFVCRQSYWNQFRGSGSIDSNGVGIDEVLCTRLPNLRYYRGGTLFRVQLLFLLCDTDVHVLDAAGLRWEHFHVDALPLGAEPKVERNQGSSETTRTGFWKFIMNGPLCVNVVLRVVVG